MRRPPVRARRRLPLRYVRRHGRLERMTDWARTGYGGMCYSGTCKPGTWWQFFKARDPVSSFHFVRALIVVPAVLVCAQPANLRPGHRGCWHHRPLDPIRHRSLYVAPNPLSSTRMLKGIARRYLLPPLTAAKSGKAAQLPGSPSDELQSFSDGPTLINNVWPQVRTAPILSLSRSHSCPP